ncbi:MULTISPECIES: SDR family oxidoreductase [unclassified Streptomyces]|uniref:SDR family oxidoreductase n=1 Tax=unclassified Streptomyces TaxID=2593676 RepID=UPI0035A87744
MSVRVGTVSQVAPVPTNLAGGAGRGPRHRPARPAARAGPGLGLRTPPSLPRGQCVPRRGRLEDVAALVAFLVGRSASLVTGQSVHVDDGWLLH